MRRLIVSAVSALTLTMSAAMHAQSVEGPLPTTALIHVEGKHVGALDPHSLQVEVNRHPVPVEAVTSFAPSSAEVAILIDEGLRGNFGNQLPDVRRFIEGLPQGTRVFVGYMQSGRVVSEHGMTEQKEVAAADLRLPLSAPGIDSSPYFSLDDFVKHWPSNRAAMRFVLFITTGVDPANGSPSIVNQDSPYVQTAQDDAQRAGVAVYGMYYPQGANRGSLSGQSYLEQVSTATGGANLYNGTFSPVDLGAYLKTMQEDIENSYLIHFRAANPSGKANTLVNIKVTSTQPGVKVRAPEAVHPGTELIPLS